MQEGSKAMQRIIIGVVGASLLLVGWRVSARAEPLHPTVEDPQCRAGNPNCVACWAVPSDTGSYVGYYVGGGCAFPHLGQGRCINEGTWGWDFSGLLFHRRVMLGWCHCRCYQGGTGAYKIDGPRLHHEEGE